MRYPPLGERVISPYRANIKPPLEVVVSDYLDRYVPTYGKHRGVKLVGNLNYETGEVYCEEHETYDAAVFLGFLENLLSRNPDGKTVLILDNARIHHAKLLIPFLTENADRLQLIFLPPYNPNLNLIEGLWKWLKERVVNNVFYHSVSEIRKNVADFLTSIQSGKRSFRDCVSSYSYSKSLINYI